MSEIVSCAKDTQLHSFPRLEQLASSVHIGNNGSYCHFFGSSKLFVRANKDWGIELLRIKPNADHQSDGADKMGGGGRTIANVKKIMIDNLYCVACPKTAGKEEIAIGLTTGTVRLMNYKKANFTKRFDHDRITIGVTFMDFNATDDFLAAVYENGLVNVYGMKTSSKLHTLAFDKNTVKARFHPTKRFSMAVASYNGAVLLYDTQAKKTLFSQNAAHAAPCRDIAMVETHPDYLFSVGYDNVINIFDTRRKETASQIQSNYPFESLAIAEDGVHFAVGNLKGYVYGYDLRSLKDPLNMQKVHQSCVNSIAFVPQSRDGSNRRSMIELDESKKATKSVRISEGGQPNHRPDRLTQHDPQARFSGADQHDSFIGEIDLFLQRRDAPIDCLSRLSTSSRLSTESRNSMQMGGNNLMGFLDELSDCNIELEMAESEEQPATDTTPGVDDSFVNVNRLLKRVKGDGSRSNTSGDRMFRKAHGLVDNLENIREEGSELGDGASEATPSRNGDPSGSSNSSIAQNNMPRILAESQQENTVIVPLLDPKRIVPSETESIAESKSDKENRSRVSVVSSIIQQEEQTPTMEAASPMPTVSAVEKRKDSAMSVQHWEESTVREDIADLRKAMMEQFEECTLRQLDAEQAMRSHLWMCMFNLWRETQSKLESLEQYVSTGLGLLLPRDEFAQQFLSMRAENESLKARLKQLEEEGGGGKRT